MSMTVLAPIPIWFVCKLCQGLFHEIDKFVKHEKEIHSVDFASVKCIIFEVTAAVINHNQNLPPAFSKILNDQEEPSLSRSSYLERLDKLTQDIFSQRIQYEYETLSAGAGQHHNQTLATTGTGNASHEEIQDNQLIQTIKMDVNPAQVIPYEFEQDIKMGRQLQLTETEAYVGARSGSGSEPDPLGTNEEIATSLLPFSDKDESSCSESIIIKHESEFEPPVSISYFEFNDSENEWRLSRPEKAEDQQVILENEETKLNREDGTLQSFARKKKSKSKSPFNPYVLLKRLSPTEIHSALDGKSSGLDLESEEPVKCLQIVSASVSGPFNSEIISTQTYLGQHMDLMHGHSSSGSSHKRPQNKYSRKYTSVRYPSKDERQNRRIKKRTSVPTMQSEVQKKSTANEFLCEICDKIFGARSCLENHNLLIHTENRPYKCNWEGCRATFKAEIEFSQHEVMFHKKIIEKFRLGLLSL